MPVNNDIASEQWNRYRWMAERGHFRFLEKADRCENFFAGNQWSEADMNQLKLAKRPAMTINKIISTVSTILGEQIFNRSEILFRPKNGSPEATAEALTKVWTQIAQNNQLPWVRSDVFADGIIRSRGFYDMRLKFDDSMQGEISIEQLNSKNVVIDPDAEQYDPDTWNDVIITKWLSPQDIAILYSEDDAEYFKTRTESSFPFSYDSIERVRDSFDGQQVRQGYHGFTDPHHVRRNVRTLERQYRRLDAQKHFVDIETGDMRPVPDGWDRNRIALLIEKAGGKINVTKKLVKRIRWTVTADNMLLHDDWSPYKHFTVIPYFPYFRYGKTIGVVENLINPQEILNKVSSQELHIVNTTANSGWKVRAGSLKNMSIEQLEQSGAQSGLVLELDDVGSAEKIQPNQTPNGLDRISYKAEEHIKTISNVSDSMQGFDREDVAAKAIQYKQQRGSVNLTKIQDNLERTDFIMARNALDLIQTYYTEERILNITHDDPLREAETITINQPNELGEIQNDLTLGEYSITITSTPYRASMEDSQFEQAMGLRQAGVAIPDEVLVENSRLNRKSDIIKSIKGDSESEEAKAAAALQRRSQEAEVAQLEAQAASMTADAELKRAKAAQTMAEGGEGGNAEQDREYALAVERMNREFELKRYELDENMKLKREAQNAEMELKHQTAEREAALTRVAQSRQTATQPTQPQ